MAAGVRAWGTRYDPGPWVGELRNMWKPTQQPGLWFHGGNLMQSRLYSLYLALQLKARMEDIESRQPESIVFEVKRGIRTMFIEIQPAWK